MVMVMVTHCKQQKYSVLSHIGRHGPIQQHQYIPASLYIIVVTVNELRRRL